MLPWNPTSITCVLYVTVGHIARRSCYGLGTLAAPKKRWTPIFEPAKHSHSWLKKVQWLFFSSNFSKRSYWKKPYFWRSTSSLSYLPFFFVKKIPESVLENLEQKAEQGGIWNPNSQLGFQPRDEPTDGLSLRCCLLSAPCERWWSPLQPRGMYIYIYI